MHVASGWLLLFVMNAVADVQEDDYFSLRNDARSAMAMVESGSVPIISNIFKKLANSYGHQDSEDQYLKKKLSALIVMVQKSAV
jgi:hypothetical protein